MPAKIIDQYSHLSRDKAYYLRHKDLIYKKQREKIAQDYEQYSIQRKKLYNKQDKKERARKRMESHEKDPRQRLLENARKRAKEQNVVCSISKDDIVIPEYCPITGLKLQFHKNKPKEDSASVDKLIPSLGYIPGNVRVISKKANRWKQEMLRENIQTLLDYVDGKI